MHKYPLNLEIGAILHLDPAPGTAGKSIQVSLLGYAPNRSLIVAPLGSSDSGVKEGAAYQAHGADRDAADGFETRVLRICKDPYPYYHLQFPQRAQQAMLRRTQRLDIEAPAVVLNMCDGSRCVSVTMIDISLMGARLVAVDSLGKVGDRFFVDLQLGEQHGKITLPFVIRYIAQDTDQAGTPVFNHGVEFSELDPHAIAFIARFIRNNVVQQRGGKPRLRVVK